MANRPVCTYSRDGTARTDINSCVGCLGKDVFAFRSGDCPVNVGGPKPRNALCGNSLEESFLCVLEYREVCGITSAGRKRYFGNGCLACQDPEVAAYTVGRC